MFSPQLWPLWEPGQPRPEMGRRHPSASPWLACRCHPARAELPRRGRLQGGPRVSHKPIYKAALIKSDIPENMMPFPHLVTVHLVGEVGEGCGAAGQLPPSPPPPPPPGMCYGPY